MILICSFLEITSNIPKRRLLSKSSCLGVNFSSLAAVRARVAPVVNAVFRTHSCDCCDCCDCILCNHRKRTKSVSCRCLLANSVIHFPRSAFVLRKTVSTRSYHRSSFCHTVLGTWLCKAGSATCDWDGICCLTGQSSLLKLGNGFQSCHVLWEINTLISDLIKFGHVILKKMAPA